MGRPRTVNRHLPVRMTFDHGAYYHTRAGQPWVHLGRDYAEALRRWAEIEGRSATPARTIADLLCAYIAASTPRLSAETVRGYQSSVKRLGPVFGHMRPADLKREHVYRYVHDRGDVAANRDRALLSAAFAWALNMGFVEGGNPAQGLGKRVAEKPRQRYVTDAELAALVAAAGPHMAQAIMLAYLTGIGQGDLLRLRLRDASKAGITYTRQKTAKRTGKPVTVQWSDALDALWRAISGDRIGDQPALRSSRGKAWTADGLRSSFATVAERAGVADVTWHDLRRKAGSDVSLEHARELLAHADVRVTGRHYRARPVMVKPVR